MRILALILLVSLSNGDRKTLIADEFSLQWQHSEEYVTFTLSAPTTGWIALGFTENKDIVDSNLIMMKVDDDLVYAEDQYVTGFGKHPTMKTLGAKPQIFDLGGSEKNGETTVTFSIANKKLDQYHFDLSEGNEIFVWLAWSVSDDFDHHSRKRILRKIEL